MRWASQLQAALSVGSPLGGGSSLSSSLTLAGGIIYPIVFRQLIVRAGFPWAVRAMGFIILITLIAAVSLLRPRLPPKKLGPLIDLQSLKDLPYLFFLLCKYQHTIAVSVVADAISLSHALYVHGTLHTILLYHRLCT